MSSRTCYIQFICPKFSTGDNMPPNEDVRDKHPCAKFIACDCDMYIELYRFIEGRGMSCKITKGGKE